MHKHIKTYVFLGLVCLFLTSLVFSSPTFATESSDVTETVFFGNVEDDGSACGVFTVLNLVVDILSIGIGILGVIGITVVGIKYLTAKDNEEQTRKAKHRMLQIVIGLATAALLYTGLQFLLPGGKLSFTTECKTMSDQDLQKIKDKEKAEQEKAAANSGSNSKPSSGSGSGSGSNSSSSTSGSASNTSTTTKKPKDYKSCMKKAAKVVRDEVCLLNTWPERIARTAELLAWSYGTPTRRHMRDNSEYGYMNQKCWSSWKNIKKKKGRPTENFMKAYDEVRKHHFTLCSDKWGNHTSVGASCDVFAGTVVRAAGYDKNMGFGLNSQISQLHESKKWKRVSKPKRGDFCNRDNHSSIYLGNNRVAEAGYMAEDGGEFGFITKGNCVNKDTHGKYHMNMRIYRAVYK